MIKTIRSGFLEYLVAEDLSASHCFTTRLGGVSEGTLAGLNIGVHRGDSLENVLENYRILGKAIGFDINKLVLTKQNHTDIVRPVTEKDWGTGLFAPEFPPCDALITNTPDTALVVFTADCTPILLQDPVTGAVGAVHAGWRGTAANIAGKTVAAMVSHYGCHPENIRAAIGPNIAQCCFATDQDVPDAIREVLGAEAEEMILFRGEKYYVNLKEVNARLLRRAGVTHIEISDACTACRQDLFWSHRMVGQARGSQGAIIVCKEGDL